jgi:hypothetical protein
MNVAIDHQAVGPQSVRKRQFIIFSLPPDYLIAA